MAVYGLLLAGGRSTRMGEDKSEMVFRDGETQAQRGLRLLGEVCDQAYLSLRAGQPHDGQLDVVEDAYGEVGPLGAIASAFSKHPDAAWLVMACDLPHVDADVLEYLLEHRDPEANATCFSSRFDGKVEPLCTIYEPSIAMRVLDSINREQVCPRRVLSQVRVKTMDLPRSEALDNANTRGDAAEAIGRLQNQAADKSLTVRYFAQLREQVGQEAEEVTTSAITPAGLYEELRGRHGFKLKSSSMMLAVNGDFQEWTYQLQAGDEVVFIPPVAGG